jgi:hypothetical protein
MLTQALEYISPADIIGFCGKNISERMEQQPRKNTDILIFILRGNADWMCIPYI